MQKPDVAYKLTKADGTTRNGLKWEIGRAAERAARARKCYLLRGNLNVARLAVEALKVK